MVVLESFNLPAVLLFILSVSCFAHDSFSGYHYLPPKPHFNPILMQQRYNHRNGFELKLSLPVLNYFNPNVLESIVTIRSEYQPVPMILIKEYINGNHIDKQKIPQQQNKAINTKTTESYKEISTKPTKKDFSPSKDEETNNKSNEIADESTTEYTEGTTEYDDLSTTEDYTLTNRIAPEVVASLLG